MITIQELTKKIIAFRDERDWKQFHNPKDLAISLVLEAGEVMEHFQWKTKEEIEVHIRTHKEDIADELADVLHYLLILSHDLENILTYKLLDLSPNCFLITKLGCFKS